MGDHTKKQHYVPQFSLRYFSAEGKGTHVYVYDKLRGESRLQSIRDVAHSNYFYNYVTESKKPATLEKDLARLEADAAKIIAQVVADESLARLGDDDRHVLAFYTGAQLLRTLHHRAYLRQLKDALRDVLASESFDKDFWIDLDQMDENTITRHHMESMKLTTEFHAHRRYGIGCC